MVERSFELPGIQDLSKEQEKARACAKEGRYLIIGGPGTGKSVLALIRSRRHCQDKDDYVFLIYNRLLRQSSEQLFGVNLESKTWKSWFSNVFRKMINNSSVPRLSSEKEGDFEEIDWIEVERVINELPPQDDFEAPFLVIDEGQDMPPEFYRTLINLGFVNFFVVADQNQTITDQNSTRENIEDMLGIETSQVIELHTNYRNTYPIARLAQHFYTDDPASPPPELPLQSEDSASQPILYSYVNFPALCKRILRLADRDPSKLIGIIAPNNKIRNRYFTTLKSMNIPLDNEPPRIETYYYGFRRNISFDEGGILVINAQSCKGLEFDIVMLADIEQHYINLYNSDATKRLFYVMVARARENIYMFMENKNNDIEEILPKDPSVLKRESL